MLRLSRTARPRFRPACEPLEPRRVLATILGIGTGALIGGDLTDPEDDLIDSVNDGAGENTNWVSTAASDENYFSPGGGSNDAALDVFDNKVGGLTSKWCCRGPEQWVAVEFDRAYTLTHFTMASGDDQPGRDPDMWEIQGSSDGENWTTIFAYDMEEVSPFTDRLQVVRFDGGGVDFATPQPHRWFRYFVSSTVNRSHQVNEIEYFGFSGLAVSAISPGNNEVVHEIPNKVTVDLTVDVDTATVNASDLLINGVASTEVTIVDANTLEFALPNLTSGTHRLEIAADAMAPIDAVHSNMDAFASTFVIPEVPVLENLPAFDVMASSATLAGQLSDDRNTTADVTLFWGNADGGSDTQAWQNSIPLGELNSGLVRGMIDGLQPNTDYFYRAHGVNAAGEAWAPGTAQFTTLDLTLPAAEIREIDFVSSSAATLSGEVTDTGGESPNVVVYFGTTNGGNVVEQWQNQVIVGERIDSFSVSIVDLAPTTSYFYTASVENGAGLAWSPTVGNFRTTDAPQIQISEIMASNNGTLTTRTRRTSAEEFVGVLDTPDWIEIENLTDAPIELGGSFLTDNANDLRKWQFPAGTQVAPNSHLVVFFSGQDITDPALDENNFLHTSFGLSDGGEYLALADSDGDVVFEYDSYPKQITDVSYGVSNGLRQYFASPTPGAPNVAETLELVRDTQFSVDRGFYSEAFTVEITSNTTDATIHFTTDGSAPSETHGEIYVNPISIDRTTTLRAIAFKPGMKAANVDTQTYIFLDDVVAQSPETTVAAGFPEFWGRIQPDYGMDPDIVGPNDAFEGRYAATIKDDLLSLPTISIVTDIEGVFGAEGIYTNPSNSNLEVPASIEMISPDGSEEFQINAGIKIQGGAFRSFDLTKKKSFRLKFKTEYGPSKLNFPLFGPDATDEFDTLTLRMEANDGWQWSGAGSQPQYARDEFGRRVQAAMGHPASKGRFIHVYLNGAYWGMYDIVERPDQTFAESYLGVDKEDWDGINSGQAINAGEDADRRTRTLDAWRELVNLAEAVRDGETEADRTAALMHIQGLHPDGTNNPDQPAYLDVVNYIDYLIVNYYGGNTDWPRKNYYLGRENSLDSEGFKFFMWDSEWSLFIRNTVDTNVLDDPAGVGLPFQHLRSSEAFRLMFADRVQKHLFHGGPLYVDPENPNWDPENPDRNVPAATYVGVSAENFSGLVAESARWGDQHRAARPYTRDAEWQGEFDRLISEWFPQRTGILIEQFQEGNLFPELEAPEYEINGADQHGGAISSGDILTIRSPTGENTTDRTMVEKASPVQYFLPTDNSLAESDVKWFDTDFDSTGWSTGTGGVGFENRPRDYTHLIDTDIREIWEATQTSLYLRYEFELPADFDSDEFNRVKLRMAYDDGFVAYVNGQQVLMDTVEEPIDFATKASGQRRDAEAAEFIDFEINAAHTSLRPGKNVLAIHGFNRSQTSSDMLIAPELIVSRVDSVTAAPLYFTLDGTDPRALDGTPQGTLYTDSFSLDQSTQVRARAIRNGEWSPVQDVTFTVNVSDVDQILISEINYNPSDPTSSELAQDATLDNSDFEFVELHNPTDGTIGLSGLQLTSGIEFEFPAVDLKANEYGVIVRDAASFALRYGDDVNVIGEFTGGSLSNGGERLTLEHTNGDTVLDFEFRDSDPWPARADGIGGTLQVNGVMGDDFSKSYNWRGSSAFFGSPGSADADTTGVVINEIRSATDVDGTGGLIELYNPTNQAADVSGWHLSDDANNLTKFAIPTGTTIAAGGYLLFDETEFNRGPSAFTLNAAEGGSVWLVATSDGQVDRFVDDIHYGSTPAGQHLGRIPNGAGRLTNITASPAAQNSYAGSPSAVISEIHFAPAAPSEAALAVAPELGRSDLEFVEIENATNAPLDLSGWQIRGGIDFDFDDGTELAAAANIVVISFNPENPDNADRLSAFQTQFGIDESVRLVGGFGGRLANGEDLMSLTAPTETRFDTMEETIFWEVDEVLYDDALPWPTDTNGDGNSLSRRNSQALGNDPSNWRALPPSPGQTAPAIGDFNNDNLRDVSDVHLLCQGVRDQNGRFDLTGDGQTDLDDLDLMIEVVLNTSVGDANLDGIFNSSDFVQVFETGEYEDAVAGNSTWDEGDWNCDGDFTSRDFVRAFQLGVYVRAAHVAVVAAFSDLGASDLARHDVQQDSISKDAAANADRGQQLIVNRVEMSHSQNRMKSMDVASTDAIFSQLDREIHEITTPNVVRAIAN